MRRLLIITLILLFAAACNHTGPPKNLIGQEKLVPILVDMHMAYAIQTSLEFRQLFRTADSVDIHGYVFEKHGVEKIIFDSTIAWYSRHPDLFTEVYDEVVMQLSRLSDSISPKYD